MVLSILILMFSVILNGVFAMAEIALVSSRETRLLQRANEKSKGAAAALELLSRPNHFLSTVQIGITLIGIFSGAFGSAKVSEPLGEFFIELGLAKSVGNSLAFFLVVVATTYFSLVIGELLPKRIALNNPEEAASALAIPMRFLSKITRPFVWLLSASTDIGMRLIGVKPSSEPSITEEEIRSFIEEGRNIGLIEEAERDMFSSVFRLGDRRVDALMTPRTELTWIDIHAQLEETWASLLKNPHSRIPVADGDLDNILGYIQVRDFLGHSPDDPDFNLKDFIKEPIYVPENMAALKALDNIQTSGVHLAVVVDEFGGITGIVTDYDILEAIVGEIPEDGLDTDALAVQREDGSWLFDGLIVIDQLKEILDISDLQGEDRLAYKTLSGFVMSQLGRIPKTGAKFIFDGYEFEVVDMDGRRVDRVLVSKIELD